MKILIFIVGARKVLIEVPDGIDVAWTPQGYNVWRDGKLIAVFTADTDYRIVALRIKQMLNPT